MIVPIGNFYSAYIKKEDAKQWVVSQRKLNAFFILMMPVIIGVLGAILYPVFVALHENQHEFSDSIYWAPYIYGVYLVGGLVIAGYLLLTPPDFKKIESIISKYKDGEMFQLRELAEKKFGIIMFLYILLSMIVVIAPFF